MRYHPTVILSPVVDILSDFKIIDWQLMKIKFIVMGPQLKMEHFCGSNNQLASYWGEISFRKFAIKTGIADCYKQDKALTLHLSCE